MTCDRCYKPLEVGEHGLYKCPFEPRPASFIVQPDGIPGGLVVENLDRNPITVYSRSQLKHEMDARGVRPMVRHVGDPGSDKSKNTSRWV